MTRFALTDQQARTLYWERERALTVANGLVSPGAAFWLLMPLYARRLGLAPELTPGVPAPRWVYRTWGLPLLAWVRLRPVLVLARFNLRARMLMLGNGIAALQRDFGRTA
jgi:hypothetical protein